MLRNYLLIAYRNLLRHKVFSLINVAGLAIGMAACILILQYVSFEMSYDTFHEKGERIYRIRFDEYQNGVVGHSSAGSSPGVGPAMKSEFSEIEEVVRLCDMDHLNHIFTYEDVVLSQKRVFMADASFFEFFSFPLLAGNPKTVLAEPWQIVISETTAKKYFKDEDPVGKEVTIHHNYGKNLYTVSGIMEDFPSNTHLDPEVLISYSTLATIDPAAETSWNWNAFLTYLLVKPDTDVRALLQKFPDIINKYKGPGLEGTNVAWELTLQPLKDIHLHSNLKFEAKPNGNGRAVKMLSAVAVIILIIAWANYINMSTSKSIERAREVGIRKIVGSRHRQLVVQFLLESLVINFLALILALTLVQIAIPFFRQVFLIQEIAAFNFYTWICLIAVFIAGSLLAGFYPAFILASAKPTTVLKGVYAKSSKGLYMRKSLVVFQFSASVILISGALAVYEQLKFMQKADLGMNIDQILVFNTQNVFPEDANLEQSVRQLKQELLQNTSIESVTTSSSIPGEPITWATNDFRRKGEPFTKANDFAVMSVDHDFINTFDLQMVSGRFFDQAITQDKESVVINEAALAAMGFSSPEEAINEMIVSDDLGFNHRIIGVAKDFHQTSLKSNYRPLILIYQEVWNKNYYEVKLDPKNLEETIQYIKSTYEQIFPGNPFEFFFLDTFFNTQYHSDQKFGNIFGLFSGLAILVACLGLFGLAIFSTKLRTKEIGVRKVLGASVSKITLMLNTDYLKLILISIVISLPLAGWGIQEWLNSYAFRISLSVWILVLPGILVLILAAFTVSFYAWKAATVDPVKSLRYD